MTIFLRIFIPLWVLAAAFWGYKKFVANKPAPRQKPSFAQVTKVEGKTVNKQSYQIYLNSRGTVAPQTTTTLFPEVPGRILSISPNFREGGFFEKDEVLITIDKFDFEAALITARGQLAEAKSNLEEERARGNQAAENWRRLGKSGWPSDIVLRKPQLAEAEARVQTAMAGVAKAQRDLERTEIRAPYAGRVLEQSVDVGQFVSSNTRLGQAFATDIMEVRLPLTNDQLGFVSLPETFRDDTNVQATTGPEVKIIARIGAAESTWDGHIVRVDSALDETTRQLFVVARIKDPYSREKANGVPLKIGMFVDAVITGNQLEDVLVIPRSTVRVSGDIILIENGKIKRSQVEPLWKSNKEVVIAETENGGLKAGDVICLTPIAYPADGAPVSATIDGVAPKPTVFEAGKGEGGKGKGKKGRPKS